MVKIYHNQNCSKSRTALELIESKGEEIIVQSYLEDVPSKQELQEIVQMLGIRPLELIRQNESIFKEKFSAVQLSDDAWLDIMIQYPILIERPIIVKNNKAVIGRPVEKILELL